VRETPPTVRVEDAWPVTVPAVGELKVIVHWPLASVFGPAFVQLPVGAVCAAPFAFARVTSTCSPAAGPKPPPMSFWSVTVNVWGAFTSFVAFGAIEIRALTQFFCASTLSPALASFVARLRTTPPTFTDVEARTTVCPVRFDVICTEQEPVPPLVVHE